ncbi:hypothetical protein GF361_03600, partial [Candidatus Woesearchaeota archaeon]|nr:hypothetical protein [Candidatus Woesearchaeota archaeon]
MNEEKTPKGLTGELSSGVKYQGKAGVPGAGVPSEAEKEKAAKEFEKLKGKLDDLKKKILKKYNFTRFLSLLPQQSLPGFAEDEGIPVEIEKTNPFLLYMCIPEEKYKEIPKIKPEIVKLIKESKENIWVIIKTEVDLWNYGLDSKFDLLDGVSASYPIYDNGFLGSLR